LLQPTLVVLNFGSPPKFNHLFILAHCQPSLKISCKSVWKSLHKVANKQTTMKTASLAEVQTITINLLGGGTNYHYQHEDSVRCLPLPVTS